MFRMRPSIPTGIRVMIEDGWVLSLYPRSGLGFRHRLQLDNRSALSTATTLG
ncbi:MAG: hypothetical protein ACLRVN_07855 [Butyricicoccus sp.]